jgi:hypothetical protein
MGTLTRFIEGIYRKLIIEAKPRQPQKLTQLSVFVVVDSALLVLPC